MALAVSPLVFCLCERTATDGPETKSDPSSELLSMRGVARMLASLPIEGEQIAEVWDAVNSSSGNGYDEEYMMRDLVGSPGAGVGDSPEARAAARAAYTTPLRDLIADYLASSYSGSSPSRSGHSPSCSGLSPSYSGLSPSYHGPSMSYPAGSGIFSRAGSSDVEALLAELASSGLQIYWPYSEQWDGDRKPLITFDPGYGATNNYAYEIAWDGDRYRVLDSVYVDENVAASRPVWVINRNDDSGYTPLDLYTRSAPQFGETAGVSADGFDFDDDPDGRKNNLFIKDFTMLRQYDSWFCGGSEFFIQAGSVYAEYANTEVNPGSFSPEVTQLMVCVRRNQLGMRIPFEALLLSGFPDALDQIALLVTESDGGTRTSWKCAAKVMVKSKSYGIDLELPFQSNDDIVWRGPISIDYLRSLGSDEGRFGDVRISFEIK